MTQIVRVFNCLDALKSMRIVPWASELAAPKWVLGEKAYWSTETLPEFSDAVCEDLREINEDHSLICDAPRVEPGLYMVTGRMELTRVRLSNRGVMAHITITEDGMVPAPYQFSYGVTGDYARGRPGWAAWKVLGSLEAVRESGVPFQENGLDYGQYVMFPRWDHGPVWLKSA